MSCKTHRTVSIPVNDLHRTWYLLHFLTSNLYTQWVYKKKFSFYPRISKSFTEKQYFSFIKEKNEMQKTNFPVITQ